MYDNTLRIHFSIKIQEYVLDSVPGALELEGFLRNSSEYNIERQVNQYLNLLALSVPVPNIDHNANELIFRPNSK